MKQNSSQKTRLLLVRHGQSEGNLEGRFIGQTDSPLTELGRAQAQCTAEYIASAFQVDKIYASDLSRAFDTGKATADKFGLPVTGSQNLREIYAGAWEGRAFTDIEENFTHSYHTWRSDIGNAVCDDGESVAGLQKRIMKAVTEIAAENAGKTVVIATHATPIRAFMCHCAGKPLSEMKDIPWVSNASVTIADYENGIFRITDAGHDQHLGRLSSKLPANV